MLNNKIIVITGGCGFLGKEFVKSVLEENGHVIIADINKPSSKFLDEIKTRSSNFTFYSLDINSKNSVKTLIKNVSQKFGKIDAWINNAYPKARGLSSDKKREYSPSFFDLDYKEFCESISINLGGLFLCCQQISSFFIKQGFGNIINVSSIYGFHAPRFEIYNKTKMTMPVDYAVNKSATNNFTRYLSKILKNKNIRVNTLSPGGIYNNQPNAFVTSYNKFALNKGMLSEKDICGTLIFLLSDYSTYINGQNIIVDDGWTL